MKEITNSCLTSIGLTGVDGKGWRYSGCKMCPVRAVSILRTLMGSRLACRKGSVGGTEWRKGLLMLTELLFRELQLSQARSVSRFLRAIAESDVLMTQFSFILAFCSSYASITTLKRSSLKTGKNKDKLIFRLLVAEDRPTARGYRRSGAARDTTVIARSAMPPPADPRATPPSPRTARNFHFKSNWISLRLKPLPPSNQMGPRGDWRVKGMWRSPFSSASILTA